MEKVTYQYFYGGIYADYLTIEPLEPYDRVSFELNDPTNALKAKKIIFNKVQLQQMIKDLENVEKGMI